MAAAVGGTGLASSPSSTFSSLCELRSDLIGDDRERIDASLGAIALAAAFCSAASALRSCLRSDLGLDAGLSFDRPFFLAMRVPFVPVEGGPSL